MKRIILWTLYAGFVLVLLMGAVNRTQAMAGDLSQSAGVNQNENQAHESDEHTDETLIQNVVQVQGVVVSMSNRELVLQLEDGSILGIARRSWRYATDQGFAPQIGDPVSVTGFYEQDSLEVISMINLNSGQMVHLRDESGRPLWATDH